ncbi:hypothetical protein [Pseudonocardia abyssalis]|uniref:ACT domain-containing protein n=1 Tax=Pseudonocardia abyssalis TaxID=2792008 RepID=A0ABS6UM85_9PSEU|nr:hypothetical protein [Pseudonocardia abyssalis]MBW0115603.1 hypothetical protein [Pseudonocardia abyssalis]MBW0133354.1 hypothetical protein [Pseudonocardia abyssalis]
MTVLDHAPRTTWTPRIPRRHEIVTTGGIEGILRVGDALRAGGYPVRDFAADVRDGVPYSSVTCTVSLTRAEEASFADRLCTLRGVVSVEPC